MVEQLDIDRANSLQVRFDSEKKLIQHAGEKIFFGWGGWSRNRVIGAITDGYWIIVVGQVGLVGYLSLFGLIGTSIFRTGRALKLSPYVPEKRILVLFSFLILIILIDQIFNSSLSSSGIYWFLIGGLISRSRFIVRQHMIEKIMLRTVN